MLQVNIFEAKKGLPRLVKMLETKEEDVIYITRDGVEIAQLTLISSVQGERIGVAKGCFRVPDEFDSGDWNGEIENLFNDDEL